MEAVMIDNATTRRRLLRQTALAAGAILPGKAPGRYRLRTRAGGYAGGNLGPLPWP